jgi:hypothetical protein
MTLHQYGNFIARGLAWGRWLVNMAGCAREGGTYRVQFKDEDSGETDTRAPRACHCQVTCARQEQRLTSTVSYCKLPINARKGKLPFSRPDACIAKGRDAKLRRGKGLKATSLATI